MVTKHVSLDENYIDKIQPYVERHSGNVSSTIRELIDKVEGSGIPNNVSGIDHHLLDWILENIDNILIPDGILDETIDPRYTHSMKNFEEYINRKFKDINWDVGVTLTYDDNVSPSNVSIKIIKMKVSYQKTKFVARLLSQCLVKNSLERNPLEIKSINDTGNCIDIQLIKSDKKSAKKSLITFFGNMNDIMKTIKDRPVFWKNLIRRHVISNYNMVTVHRNYFEDIILGNVPMGEIMIETIARRPVRDIPKEDMLSLIKQVYENSRVADRVDITDGDRITVFHNFRDLKAVDKIRKSLVMILEANGHLYDARMTSNAIMLRHRPDIGIKINEIVNNLKASNSSVDQQLIMFMTFIKGLKEFPDMPLCLTSLGRRIGKGLLQEYEKENNIKKWDLEEFKKALEMINAKIHMDSEWILEGNRLLYKIKRCSLAKEGNILDSYICRTSREVFKGALGYVFGNRAEIEVKKLLSHGDNYCEIIIKLNKEIKGVIDS